MTYDIYIIIYIFFLPWKADQVAFLQAQALVPQDVAKEGQARDLGANPRKEEFSLMRAAPRFEAFRDVETRCKQGAPNGNPLVLWHLNL